MNAKSQQNANRLFVIALAYALVHLVEGFSGDFNYYYFNLIAVGFVVVLFSLKANDFYMRVYAWLNILTMFCYSMMLTGLYSFFDYILYLSTLNISAMVYCFELIILIMSGGGFVISWFLWFVDNVRCGVHNYAHTKTNSES